MSKSWPSGADIVLASGKPVVGPYLGRILEELSEVIIPPGGELPIAINETGAMRTLAQYLRDLDAGARFGIKALLIAFDLLPFLFIFRPSRFVNLSSANKDRYLLNWTDSRIYYRRMAVVLLKTIIGITSHPDSRLRELSDVLLDMGIIEEPCPLGLTPSASIAVMLAITDALALTLMELKGITKHDYGLRHHGGYLGRKARTDNV